jgi:Fic family protein
VFHYEFKFIHPFADSNGRMGTVADINLNPLESLVRGNPVESLVYEHRAKYYQAPQNSMKQTDSAPFIEFILRMIL